MANIMERRILIKAEHGVLRVFQRGEHLQPEKMVFDLRFYSAVDGPEICSLTVTKEQVQSAFGIYAGSDWFPQKGT